MLDNTKDRRDQTPYIMGTGLLLVDLSRATSRNGQK